MAQGVAKDYPLWFGHMLQIWKNLCFLDKVNKLRLSESVGLDFEPTTYG